MRNAGKIEKRIQRPSPLGTRGILRGRGHIGHTGECADFRKKPALRKAGEFLRGDNGDPGRNRTCDPQLRRLLL
jgi:hypothetical protein